MMRHSLGRNLLKDSSGSHWTLTTTKLRHPDRTFTILSRPWQVITCVATASSSGFLRKHVAGSPTFALPGRNAPKKPESRSQYLNGLVKFIFPMYFLQADDVLVVRKPSETVMFLFLGNRKPNKTFYVPSNSCKTANTNMDTCVPMQATSLYLRSLKTIPPST